MTKKKITESFYLKLKKILTIKDEVERDLAYYDNLFKHIKKLDRLKLEQNYEI